MVLFQKRYLFRVRFADSDENARPAGAVIFVFLVLVQEHEGARVCFSCTNLAENEKCEHAITCQDDEVCFVQKYKGVGNITHYDVGCTISELCRKDVIGTIIGKRSDHSHVICQSCCDENVCNTNITCKNNQQVTSQKCLSCSEISDPAMCKSYAWCEKNEVCFVHGYRTEMNKQQYDLGCKHSNLCLHGYTHLFGRRSTAGKHLLCESCCSGTALCNMDLKCGQQKQKPINSSCAISHECSSNLVCLSGRCQCSSDDNFWEVNMCVKRKPIHAICSRHFQCEKNLRCEGRTCQCDSSKYWNGSLCLQKKALNTSCTTTNECKNTLFCIHGTCNCAFDVDEWDGNACVLRKVHYECADIRADIDGKYAIHPSTRNQTVFVYCVMEQNKKWTVIQRRYNGSVAFTRNWTEYKHGFGNVEGEYWLGNDLIHSITRNGHHELSIHLVDGHGRHGYANYSTFSIGDETSQYVLHIAGYTGNVGDSMDKYKPIYSTLNGKKFYTGDRTDSNNCALTKRGGWWYNQCFYAHLNIQYGDICWRSWSSAIKQTIMMIRRV